MSHFLRSRRASLKPVALALIGVSIAVGCTAEIRTTRRSPDAEDTNSTDLENDNDSGEQGDDDPETTADAGVDAADACAEGSCVTTKWCDSHPEAAFCDDFDSDDALTVGKTKWDFVEQLGLSVDEPVVSLSSVRAVSAPNSILTRVIDGSTPGAKFSKTTTAANFTEVTWEYDVYLESIGDDGGFFLDDFQFVEGDKFGFRLVVIADGNGGLAEIKVEHNRDANGGSYVIENPFAAGTVELGKWHHVKQSVAFTFGDDESSSVNDEVTYSISIDGTAPTGFPKTYPGVTREQASFARIAAMAFIFDKAKSAGLKIHWDNHLLELK